MRPGFWDGEGAGAQALRAALAPASMLYGLAGAVRGAVIRPTPVPAHVICVGAAAAGGSGKTPTAMALARALREGGRNPAILARGHGGRLEGPLKIEPEGRDATEVGDEAPLLSAAAPTFIARRRDRAASMAAAAGHDVLVMDDGLTHPRLKPDRALLVLDASERPDRARVLPAGPLREPWARTLRRADAALVMGEGPAQEALSRAFPPDRLFRGRLAPTGAPPMGPLLAFAGLGRPEKFFESLDAAGGEVAARRVFPDHHVYDAPDLASLTAEAERLHARLVTTEKDAVKLPAPFRARVAVFAVQAEIEDEARLLALLMAPR